MNGPVRIMLEQERGQTALMRRLEEDRPLVAVELRPPRADLSHAKSIDTWIDMHHGVRRILARDTFVFLTDNAVGQNEEENLYHLQVNLAQDVDPARLVPFLTCKHSQDYCLMFADRAASQGYQSLTVLGGDSEVGQARCVHHAYELRAQLRDRTPGLALGGWANPHRDPARQVDFLLADDFHADYYLTQVVSHHDLRAVEAFVEEARRREVPWPAVVGVFFYRSANAKTLRRLKAFLPVPAEQLTAEFEAGASAEDVCARTIRALREVGVQRVYVSNFEFDRAPARLNAVLDRLG